MSGWRGSVVQGCGRGGRRGNRGIRWGARRAGAVPLARGLLPLLAAVLALAASLPGSAAGVVTPRIVGGAGVPITDFPFQVALYDPHANSVSAGFFCGGVVIDATHVATAAHCVINEANGEVTPPWDISVLAGSSSLGSATQSPVGAIEDPAAATSIDPSYNAAINDYDVAVIALAHPLWSGPTPPIDGRSVIAPIQVSATLASAYASPSASAGPILATVSGWGDTRAEASSSQGLNGTYPSNLQATQLPLVASSTCGTTYADPLSSQPITPRMLCAGFPAGGSDSCFGDSGGPLVVDRDSPAAPPHDYVLAGLVSFGEGCAQTESPGVYASIADPAIAAFLTSDPPQTPLGQGSFAHSRYVHTCARRQRPCRVPVVASHHPHHHHHHPHHHHGHRHGRAA
jgi:secreted trypsin-like serine protease